MTLQDAFNLGAQHHQAGRLAEAEAVYRQILVRHPNEFQAICRLGIIAQQMGRMEEAVVRFRQALKLAPDQFEALNNYGGLLVQMGKFEEAAEVCRLAVRRKPESPELQCNLGGILWRLGRLDEGRAAYRQALALKPSPALQMNLGMTLLRVARLFDEAIECFGGLVGKGNRALDHSAYWGLRETGLAKAAAISQGGETSPRLPYLGDKVILLHCDRAVREQLRAAGLHGGYAIDPRDGIEVWLSAQLAAHPDAGKLRALVEQWLQWIRNEAAMSGTTCAFWIPDISPAVAQAVRRSAAEDLIEITGNSAQEVFAQLAARAVAPPDTEDKCFAVVSIRNGGVELLPHWLEHYTRLGVDEILLGIFDDLAADAMVEIENCAARWKFRRFAQHWGGQTEPETYSQRETGCRRAGARPGTWILHTDLDEFHQYPAPLKEVTAESARRHIKAVCGRFVDRVAADGSLPPIRPHPSLWEQFPVGCNLTEGILKGLGEKVMMARFSVFVESGHHVAPLERADPALIGRVAHFKWHSGLLERMRWGLRQENASVEWKVDTRRFLAWLESNGGKINLSDPALVRKS
jgi:tetratricopeptide (TPR) repeat protein